LLFLAVRSFLDNAERVKDHLREGKVMASPVSLCDSLAEACSS
jgi:hypothetical protein